MGHLGRLIISVFTTRGSLSATALLNPVTPDAYAGLPELLHTR